MGEEREGAERNGLIRPTFPSTSDIQGFDPRSILPFHPFSGFSFTFFGFQGLAFWFLVVPMRSRSPLLFHGPPNTTVMLIPDRRTRGSRALRPQFEFQPPIEWDRSGRPDSDTSPHWEACHVGTSPPVCHRKAHSTRGFSARLFRLEITTACPGFWRIWSERIFSMLFKVRPRCYLGHAQNIFGTRILRRRQLTLLPPTYGSVCSQISCQAATR